MNLTELTPADGSVHSGISDADAETVPETERQLVRK